jgi:hypothetical protein
MNVPSLQTASFPTNKNSGALVRKRTIPTERPPLVGEVSVNFSEIKMNRHAFVSINHMRAGHASFEASLNRFNIMSTAECECGDGPQTEERIFWDCKLYEDKRATMMAILSQNSKK